ncbi:MAG: hypothetical protein KatS3mg061_1290 [Dehalococcoidia bacterium]|nr:MAG: hypothetical protein KatS3mg061_1290 [Dehalococcoidia bacterium]
MASEGLFREIQAYLNAQARSSAEDVMIEGGVLLALLVKRGLTTRDREFLVRPDDRDRHRLLRYLIDPGLAPDLATTAPHPEGVLIRPNWPRLAEYFGQTPAQFQDLLARRFRKVLERNWPTIQYLMSKD